MDGMGGEGGRPACVPAWCIAAESLRQQAALPTLRQQNAKQNRRQVRHPVCDAGESTALRWESGPTVPTNSLSADCHRRLTTCVSTFARFCFAKSFPYTRERPGGWRSQPTSERVPTRPGGKATWATPLRAIRWCSERSGSQQLEFRSGSRGTSSWWGRQGLPSSCPGSPAC